MQHGEVSGSSQKPARAIGPSGALLAIEVAADSTGVVLVERVEETFRFVARAERPSTHRPPTRDAMPAVCDALAELERLTGRRLLLGDTVLTPQRRDGSGVDAVVVSSSDLAPLTVLLIADSRSRSAQHTLPAMRSVPTTVLDVVDPRSADFEQRCAACLDRGVDCIVVSDPSPSGVTRIAGVLESIVSNTRSRPVAIICGAEPADLPSIQDLDVRWVPRPGDRAAGAAGLHAALRRLMHELLPVRLPGLRRLQSLSAGAVGSVFEDQGLTLRFLATQRKRSLLYVHVDAGATFAAAAGKQSYSEAIDAQQGLRAGAPEIVRRHGIEAVARWLLEPVAAAALRNRIMNRSLRPRLPSIDGDDLALDAALLREALSEVLQWAGASRTLPDTLIGGGSLATCPQPALSALALLDLLPAAQGLVELALDRGMLATAGSLARIDPTAAAALADSGEALATAILLGATPPLLQTVGRVELTPHQGTAVSIDVRRGQVIRLPLARGKRAELRVRPAGLAAGAGGAELHRQISGSILGVVVDARPGRPALPTATAKRAAAIQSWLAALDTGGSGTV